MTTSSPAPCRAKQNAPEAVGATIEGESQSRWSGSQNEVQTIIKEQIVNSAIMTPTTDTDNPADEYVEQPEVIHDFDGVRESAIDHLRRLGCAQFDETLIFSYQDVSDEDGPAVFVAIDGAEDTEPFFVWLDETHTGVLVHVRRIMPEPEFATPEVSPLRVASRFSPSTERMLRESWAKAGIPVAQVERMLGIVPVEVDWTETVDAYFVADRAETLRALEGVTDPAVARRICEQNVPTFPLSSCRFPEAKWADTVDEPKWIAVDNIWQRGVSRTWSDENVDGVVELSGYQECRAPGLATFTGFMLDVEVIDDELSTDAARALAVALNEVAEITSGPRPADRQALTSTQQRVVSAIRRRIKELPIGQNQVAVAAGYGQDELSALMTGKRLMDLDDLDRIARGLSMDPLDLLAAASEGN